MNTALYLQCIPIKKADTKLQKIMATRSWTIAQVIELNDGDKEKAYEVLGKLISRRRILGVRTKKQESIVANGSNGFDEEEFVSK